MSKNLKIKKIRDGNYKTLIITNNDENKKFSLRNVKKIYNKLMLTNNRLLNKLPLQLSYVLQLS